VDDERANDMRAMLEARADFIVAMHPGLALVAAQGIRDARATGVPVDETLSLEREHHGDMYNELDRILALLATAERELPEHASELEQAVLRILDPDS
jgi:hypothetical protein